jgi:hypothetical protein
VDACANCYTFTTNSYSNTSTYGYTNTYQDTTNDPYSDPNTCAYDNQRQRQRVRSARNYFNPSRTRSTLLT